MEPRELDDRIQISSLSDIRAALPKIATELKRAKVRHNGKAVRPAHLVSALICYYLLEKGRARYGLARKAFASLATVQDAHPEYEFVFAKKGDPELEPESIVTHTEHGIGVRSRKSGELNRERVNKPVVKNGSPKR